MIKKTIKHLSIISFIFLLSLPLVLFSQQSSQYEGKGLNKDKIELLYRNVEVTRTSSNGSSYSYNTEIPQLRINNMQPIDFKTEMILPFLKECPRARREARLFDQETKKSRKSFWTGIIAGGGIALTGFLTNAVLLSNDKTSVAPFAIGFGLGIGSGIFGVVKSRKHRKEATRHMENTVKFYNQRCYTPEEINSISQSTIQDTLPLPNRPITTDGITKNYKDTVNYRLLENDPQNYRFASLNLIIGDVDGTNNHGFTYRSGLSLNLQGASRFYANASYKIALVDNLTGTSDKGTNKSSHNPLIEPTDYQRAHELSFVGGLEISGRNYEVMEEIPLGRQLMGGVVVQNQTEIKSIRRISWSLRAGGTAYRSVLYTENGLHFASSEAPRTEVVNPLNGETITLYFDDIDNGMAMLRSTSLSAGISRRTIRNLKIEVTNTAFKGKKRNSFVGEWYADLMYAPKVALGNLHYTYDVIQPYDDPDLPEQFSYEITPDLTPLRKLGWRAGYRIYSTKGLDFQMEVGQRPGLTKGMGYLSCSAMKTFGKEF